MTADALTGGTVQLPPRAQQGPVRKCRSIVSQDEKGRSGAHPGRPFFLRWGCGPTPRPELARGIPDIRSLWASPRGSCLHWRHPLQSMRRTVKKRSVGITTDRESPRMRTAPYRWPLAIVATVVAGITAMTGCGAVNHPVDAREAETVVLDSAHSLLEATSRTDYETWCETWAANTTMCLDSLTAGLQNLPLDGAVLTAREATSSGSMVVEATGNLVDGSRFVSEVEVIRGEGGSLRIVDPVCRPGVLGASHNKGDTHDLNAVNGRDETRFHRLR